jgi:hypothetical protein
MKTLKRYIFLITLALGIFMLAACGTDSDGGSAEIPEVDDGLIQVRYKMNGGVTNALGNTSDVVLRGVKAGTIFFDLPDKPTPSWVTFDRAFAAWNSQSDGGGTFYYPETPVIAPEGSKELVLYAVYADDISNFSNLVCNDPYVVYTISYDTVLGTMPPACGSPEQPFMGKFFGNGYKISYEQSTGGDRGLFGYLDGAVISDLAIEVTGYYGLRATGTGGILAGTAKNSSIRNVSVSGLLNGGGNDVVMGGVVGILDNSTVSGAFSNARFAVGNIYTNNVMGGIAGYVGEGSVITDSVHQADLKLNTTNGSAEHIIGGIAGINDGGTIKSSYSDSNLQIFQSIASRALVFQISPSASGGMAGGIVGDHRSGTVKECLAFGNMINLDKAGRIAGNIEPGATVENNYADGYMLINYEAAADSDKDGEKLDIAFALKSRAFFRDTLNFNFNGVWIMPDYYDFPVFMWQQDELRPYIEISSAAELQGISGDRRYILVNDIDLARLNAGEINEGEWEQITDFTGILDGSGHIISNLKMTETGNLSMFGTVSGTIKNIKLDNVNIAPAAPATAAGSNTNMAALAQTLSASGVIESVRVSGNIIGGNNIGGLAVTHRGTIRKSSFDGITAADYTGAGGYLGGLVSSTAMGSYILLSSSSGERQYLVLPDVTAVAAKYLGGLAGQSTAATIISSYSTADFYSEGASVYMGGIAGYFGNTAIVDNSGTVFINTYAAGSAFSRAVPLGTTATATTAATYFGGLFGTAVIDGWHSTVHVHKSFADAQSVVLTLDDEWVPQTLTRLNLSAGGMYGSWNLGTYGTYNHMNVFSNNYLTRTTIGGSTASVGVNAEQLSEITLDFYKNTLGWDDFDLFWKIPEGSVYPILQWQEE